MKTTMKFIFAALGLTIAVFSPFITVAETSVFSGQGAAVYASSSGVINEVPYWLHLSVFENASKSKSVKGGSSGAYINGYISDGGYFYYFWGETTAIEFNASKAGSFPEKVTASGSIPITGFYWGEMSPTTDFSDTVTFNINAEALIDQAYSSSGKDHYDYGSFKQNVSWDEKNAPASLSESFITGSFFSKIPSDNTISQSKGHTVEIIK
ncbi:hypothetical protein [Methylosarcina fibrata]|uniref:hypothetical protein n=1 Tax=Methylosarcina fibrata TaxID=105972 RepID=UPI0003649EA2|nr:hypothetical protein [Methylosarcina fibrata]